jgi:GAF domain-containing protein
VEPVPETQETLERLVAQGDTMLPTTLLRMGRRAKSIVPDCVGLSLALLDHGLTLTLAATSEAVAGLDAVQYLDGGPCILGAHEGRAIGVTPDELLSEDRWQMYAQATAAAGVRSSLTLPILDNAGFVIGTVNLYGATSDAFAGYHDALADALHASAATAVTNADLSFSTRLAAVEVPHRLAEQNEVDIALGIIAESQGVDISTARERLRQAAARADITEGQAARAIRGLLGT